MPTPLEAVLAGRASARAPRTALPGQAGARGAGARFSISHCGEFDVAAARLAPRRSGRGVILLTEANGTVGGEGSPTLGADGTGRVGRRARCEPPRGTRRGRAGDGPSAGYATQDVPAREPEPAVDHEHQPARASLG